MSSAIANTHTVKTMKYTILALIVGLAIGFSLGSYFQSGNCYKALDEMEKIKQLYQEQ